MVMAVVEWYWLWWCVRGCGGVVVVVVEWWWLWWSGGGCGGVME